MRPVYKNQTRISKEEKEITTVYHKAENYLSSKYDFRYNTITLDIESAPKNSGEYQSCNDNSIWLELQKKGIRISQSGLIAILKSDFVPLFNPLVNYFTTLPKWDKRIDYIEHFANYVKLKDPADETQFKYHFKKWCVRAIKCALIEDYFNKQAFVLTDDGNGQNIGKSSWCRFLCPPKLKYYIAEDISNDKDARILLCKNFLINLDELAALSKKEINQLKAFFSKAQINERLPYDRKNSIIPRVASFLGSTNMSNFLQDETGSVRWLCFSVEKIDWSYKQEFNIDNLWSQAYYLLNDTTFFEDMTIEDIRENERRNEKFQIISPEVDMINKFFERKVNIDQAEFLSATEVLNYINLHTSHIRMSNVGIGKALKSIGHTQTKYKGYYGYWMVKKPLDKVL